MDSAAKLGPSVKKTMKHIGHREDTRISSDSYSGTSMEGEPVSNVPTYSGLSSSLSTTTSGTNDTESKRSPRADLKADLHNFMQHRTRERLLQAATAKPQEPPEVV